MDTSRTAGDDEQRDRAADECSDEEGEDSIEVVDEAGIEAPVRREEHQQHVGRPLPPEGRARQIGEGVAGYGAMARRVSIQARHELLVGRERRREERGR